MTMARISLGWDCNLDCSYCCNKLPGIKESFIPVNMLELDWSTALNDCDVIHITGGEPTLYPDKVKHLLDILNERHPEKKIYLWTNGSILGTLLEIISGHDLSGITLSVHSTMWHIVKNYWFHINAIVPLRIAVRKDSPFNTEVLKDYCKKIKVELIEWELNDMLNMPPEKRFLLTD